MTSAASSTSSNDLAEVWPETPGMGRGILKGAVVGTLLAFVVTTVGMLAAGVDMGSALGLGLFIGFWGGLGFGCMVGGVLWATSHEEHPGSNH